MHRSLFAFAALSALALSAAACSGNDGTISVTGADGALTDSGNDKLFTVSLDDGRSDGYDIGTLVVKATPDGKDAITVTHVVHDTNSNGKLDKGETIDCTEGTNNDFGTSLSGKDLKVELFATIDGKSDERVGDTTWTPK